MTQRFARVLSDSVFCTCAQLLNDSVYFTCVQVVLSGHGSVRGGAAVTAD